MDGREQARFWHSSRRVERRFHEQSHMLVHASLHVYCLGSCDWRCGKVVGSQLEGALAAACVRLVLGRAQKAHQGSNPHQQHHLPRCETAHERRATSFDRR